MGSKLVSVVIINYNGIKFLQKCFSSLLKTEYDNFEVIFVDNGSSDKSVEFIKSNFPDSKIKFVIKEKNFGVPGARNIGFKEAKGDFVVFLDNDTEVDKNWLDELIAVFESDHRIAVAQCKLLNMVERKKFDHAGDKLTPFGFLYERSGQDIDNKGDFDKVEDILNAKGAATMIRSPVFKQLGMYDDSYFMYQEETDFCYRAWLAGYRVVFAPKAIVWHAFNTPLKKTKQFYSFYAVRFYGCRNYIMTLLKNLSFGNLLWILPFHILGWLILSIAFLCKGKFKDSFWIIKAIFWNIFHFPSIMKKRSIVQKQIRKIPDNQFLEKVMTTKPASFYLRKAGFYILGIPFKK